MELYIHYTTLPEGKKLEDVVEELNEVLGDGGVVCGGVLPRKRVYGDQKEHELLSHSTCGSGAQRCAQSHSDPSHGRHWSGGCNACKLWAGSPAPYA